MEGRKAKASDAGSSQWDMVAIVKKKIVFSKRPMPIVGKAATMMEAGR
jgi:chromosome transmission fidelity protein 8